MAYPMERKTCSYVLLSNPKTHCSKFFGHQRAIGFICQKKRKGDFEVVTENTRKRIQLKFNWI
jgi:hypothetical protein